jgi:hypothetical protein
MGRIIVVIILRGGDGGLPERTPDISRPRRNGNAAKIDVAVIKDEHFHTRLAHSTWVMCNARAAA